MQASGARKTRSLLLPKEKEAKKNNTKAAAAVAGDKPVQIEGQFEEPPVLYSMPWLVRFVWG